MRVDYTSQIITIADELGHAAILLQILLSLHVESKMFLLHRQSI
jgi:hypothetical protein